MTTRSRIPMVQSEILCLERRLSFGMKREVGGLLRVISILKHLIFRHSTSCCPRIFWSHNSSPRLPEAARVTVCSSYQTQQWVRAPTRLISARVRCPRGYTHL